MELVSAQTKRHIAEAFCRSAGTSLVRDSADHCSVVAADDRTRAAPLESDLLLITISSWVFRLLTIFQVSTSQVTRDYYIGGATERTLDDAFAEFANMCCGALNRELSQQFPHMAMSIPYKLSRPCIGYLDQLQPQYLSRFDITINESIQLQATVCMCCQVPVEFVSTGGGINHDGGELEMF
jgi:hypothetical protein